MCCSGEVDEKKPKAKPKKWFEPGEGDMNESEVLFSALLLCKSAESASNGRDELQKWSSAVLSEEKNAIELKQHWKPPTDKRVPIDFFGPLIYVFKNRGWPRPELTAVGLAMQAWRGAGQFDGLTGDYLQNYFGRTPLAIKVSSKRPAPVRWKSWAVVRIARLLHGSFHALRALLKLDAESEDAKPSFIVMAEQAERITSLERELQEQTAAANKIKKAWRMSAARLKAKNSAVTEARRDERSKAMGKKAAEVAEVKSDAKRKIEEIRASARHEAEDKCADKLSASRARARKVEKLASLYQPTLKRAKEAEEELKSVKADLEEKFEAEEAMDESGVLSAADALTMWCSRCRRGSRRAPQVEAVEAAGAPSM